MSDGRTDRVGPWVRRVCGLVVAGLVAGTTPVLAQSPDRITHLLSRATYGVRPADIAAVRAVGIEAWLDRQLHPERIDDPLLEARLIAYPLARADVATLIRDYAPPRRPADPPGDTATARRDREAMSPEQRRELALRSPQRILGDLVGARIQRAVLAERQLEEVMTDFWYNHFNVFFNKRLDRYLVGDYERSAIRPHVFGRFEDMLIATAQHPAMLFYLDNFTSAAPDSVTGRGAGDLAARRRVLQRREPGINENYARELLELHTLGVDGGYTQDDVVAVARAFTGWTLTGVGGGRGAPAAPGTAAPGAVEPRFRFAPGMHDGREKLVLGTTLPAGRGIEDGLDVLRLLAQQPSTARFLSTKLVERFVSDDVDAELVDQLTDVYLRTGGDLREVTSALFTSERFYAAEHVRSKVKTPFELVASALRVTHADVGPSRRLIETLRTLGQLPYTEAAPTGFPASSDEWVNSGALLNRMNFALALAGNGIDGVRVDLTRIGLLDAAADPLEASIAALLPGVAAAPVAARIREDLAARPAANDHDRDRQALGLVLGSPEFQRR